MLKITLRDYQDSDSQEVMHLLQYNQQVVLIGPTGSGKTLEAKIIADSILTKSPESNILIATTMNHISDGFITKTDQEIYSPKEQGKITKSLKVISKTRFRVSRMEGGKRSNDVKNHLNGEGKSSFVMVISHTILAQQKDLVSFLPEKCSDILLIVDEGQHSDFGVNGLGLFIEELVKRGGRVLYLTAVPYRTVGLKTYSIVGNCAIVERKMRPHQEQGYAPLNVDFSFISVLDVKTKKVSDILIDDAGSIKEEYHHSYAKAIVDKWVKDGRPKQIVIIPRGGKVGDSEKFTEIIISELKKVGVSEERILNAVGSSNAKKNEVIYALANDKNGKIYDVVIGCKRFNEGADWPCGTSLTIIGFSPNIGLFYNRVGRVMRLRSDIWENNDNIRELYKNKETYVNHSSVTVFVPQFEGNEDHINNEVSKQILLNLLVGIDYEAMIYVCPISFNTKRSLMGEKNKLSKKDILAAAEITKICYIPEPISKGILLDILAEKRKLKSEGMTDKEVTKIIMARREEIADKYEIDEEKVLVFLIEALSPKISKKLVEDIVEKIKHPPSIKVVNISNQFKELIDTACQELIENGMCSDNLLLYSEIKISTGGERVRRLVQKLSDEINDMAVQEAEIFKERFYSQDRFKNTPKVLIDIELNQLNESNASVEFKKLGRFMDMCRSAFKSGVEFKTSPDLKKLDKQLLSAMVNGEIQMEDAEI